MRWRPDTCGCVLLVALDPGATDYRLVSAENKCQAHAAVADHELIDVVLNGENRRKNYARAELIENPSLGIGVALPDGSLELSPDYVFDWEFEGSGKDRTLRYNVTGPGIDAAKAARIQSAIEARVGSRGSTRMAPRGG